ncbi:MAG: FAD-binding oxidoreductase [Ilumatobacteraceae bacterium]
MGEATEPIEFGAEPANLIDKFNNSGGNRNLDKSTLISDLTVVCATSTVSADTAQHGRDWWPITMHWSLAGVVPRRPIAVCRPASATQVSEVVRVCAAHDLPLTVSGGRSGVSGAAIPIFGGVVVDTTSMSGICSVDSVSGIVEVLPGTFGPELENELGTNYRLTIGHFPQSFDISTVGGWVACRGAGQYSTRYGKIEEMVVGLEVVLADGSIITTGGAPAAAIGPDITSIFIGSEGTLGIITRVWLRAHPLPSHERRSAYSFNSFVDGINACRDIVRAGATPAVLRLYDSFESARSHGTDGTTCTLLVLDAGDETLTEATMHIVDDVAHQHGASDGKAELVENWMQHRNDTSALQALTRRGFIVDTMEVAAPWSKLPEIVDKVRSALLEIPGTRAATCHLSHSYIDGACLYFTFAAEVESAKIDSHYVALWDAAQRAAIGAGSNLSHHHGIGINRGRFMAESLGGAFAILQTLKSALDPGDILNPGKLGLPTRRGNVVWP